MTRRHATYAYLLALLAAALVAPGRASASRPATNPSSAVYHAATLSTAPRMCARGNACARPRRSRGAQVGEPVAFASPLSSRRVIAGVSHGDGVRRLSSPSALANLFASGRDGGRRGPFASDRLRRTVPAAFFHEAHAPPASSPRSAGRPV